MKKKISKKLILASIIGTVGCLLTTSLTTTAFVLPNNESFKDKTRRLLLNYSGSIYDKTTSVKFINQNWNSHILSVNQLIDNLGENINFAKKEIIFNVIKDRNKKPDETYELHKRLIDTKKTKYAYEYNKEIEEIQKLNGVINFKNNNQKIIVVTEGTINSINLSGTKPFGIIFPSEFPILYGNDLKEQKGMNFKFPIPNKISGVETIDTWSTYGLFKTSSFDDEDYRNEMIKNIESHFDKSVDKIIYIKNSQEVDLERLAIAKKLLKNPNSENITIVNSDFISKINNIYSVKKTIAEIFKKLKIINDNEYNSLQFVYQNFFNEKFGLNKNGKEIIKNEKNQILNIWATNKEIYNILTSLGYYVRYVSFDDYKNNDSLSKEDKEELFSNLKTSLISDETHILKTYKNSLIENNSINVVITPEWNLYTNKRLSDFIHANKKLDSLKAKYELHTIIYNNSIYTDLKGELIDTHGSWNAHV